ncbi:MAG: DUF1566 domain-containing protein [Flavobacterium sp.]|nr:DUF1566 domain-containing protein [Flavobacterium sp.]
MKKLFTLIALIASTTTFAQAPQGFNYQATVRNAAGDLIINQNVTFKFNIMLNTSTSLPVFSETHYVPTDDLGQVNLTVGQGTATIGTFAGVNWGSGTYYLGIELNTGASFVAMGTTQLLSVPYALYANSSGNAQAATPNLADVLAVNNGANNLQIKNLADPTDAQDAVTKSYSDVQLQAQVTQLQAQIEALQNYNTTNGFTHYIGELYGGGIVVSVWKTADVEHGLIASLTNLSLGIQWTTPAFQYIEIGSTAQSPRDGFANTNAIVAQAGPGTDYAAGLCKAYNAGGYTDWYLPAINELKQCYNSNQIVNEVLGDINGFEFSVWDTSVYWSSTENDNNAWVIGFGSGGSTVINGKKSSGFAVRAVRRF